MKRLFLTALILGISFMLMGADGCEDSSSQETKDASKVNDQQEQYSKTQPIPWFDHSRERSVYTQIYQARNRTVATHTIWRSNTGKIEGDCPSIGFPIPYDVQLTNPLKPAWDYHYSSNVAIEQAEPNGMFSSKTTAATWVMCAVKDQGVVRMAPVYVESKVTCYPFPMKVDYKNDTAVQAEGTKSTVLINEGK